MRVERLDVTQFRNHARTTVAFGEGINALIGENGQGKTNILEAVSYLSLSKSFYAATDVQAVMVGKSSSTLRHRWWMMAGQRADIRVVFHARDRREDRSGKRSTARPGFRRCRECFRR